MSAPLGESDLVFKLPTSQSHIDRDDGPKPVPGAQRSASAWSKPPTRAIGFLPSGQFQKQSTPHRGRGALESIELHLVIVRIE
jgi:hypothetical protein